MALVEAREIWDDGAESKRGQERSRRRKQTMRIRRKRVKLMVSQSSLYATMLFQEWMLTLWCDNIMCHHIETEGGIRPVGPVAVCQSFFAYPVANKATWSGAEFRGVEVGRSID